MKFEVGQDRVEVHFLAAYSDAIGFSPRFVELLGVQCPEFLIKVFEKKYTIWYSVEGLNKLYLHIEDKILKKPDLFYKKIKNKFNHDHKKAILLLKNVTKDKPTDFNDILESIRLITVYLPVLRYFEVIATRRLKGSLDSHKTKLSDDELFKLVSVDNYKSLILKENIDLFKIAIKFYNNQDSKEIKEYLKKHVEKYSHVELHASTRSPLTRSHFRKKLEELLKSSKHELIKRLRDSENTNRRIKQEKQKITERYKFNGFEKEIIKTLALSSEIKAKITDWVCLVNYAMVTTAELLSREWGILKEKFYLLFPEEIIRFCKTSKPDKKILQKLNLRNHAVIWYKNTKLNTYFGRQAKSFLKGKITEDKIESDKIKGTPIFKGKLKGAVRIIKGMKDFPKVKKGDILVSSDTTPDFLPVFKKVSAIITDEGGVICHAAIVAREMKIPCVVGTKIATKILKDNDIIELDASSGFIKILNKNKK